MFFSTYFYFKLFVLDLKARKIELFKRKKLKKGSYMLIAVNCDFANKIEELTGIKALSLKPYSKLDLPVSSHADMLLFNLEKTVFCYKDYFLENQQTLEAIKNAGYNLKFVSSLCSKEYPNDIALNVLKVGNRLVCNLKHTAKEIADLAKELNYEIINVKQGYSACSTAVIDENNVITSDIGIANALIEKGVNALLIDNSDIKLKGYSCGFIGGASLVYENYFLLLGDINRLKDCEKIKIFTEKCNKKLIFVPNEHVTDFGGAKLF